MLARVRGKTRSRLPAAAKIPRLHTRPCHFSVPFTGGHALALKLVVHLVDRHVHLVEPALEERRIVGLQSRVALCQTRDFDLLREDLVV